MEIKYLEMLLEYIKKDIDNLESNLITKRAIGNAVKEEIDTIKEIEVAEPQNKEYI